MPGNSDIDGRIASWARANSPSGVAPAARLASGGSDGQVLTRTATGQAWEDAAGGGAISTRGAQLAQWTGFPSNAPTAAVASPAVTWCDSQWRA